jgi:hypothetical protein
MAHREKITQQHNTKSCRRGPVKTSQSILRSAFSAVVATKAGTTKDKMVG